MKLKKIVSVILTGSMVAALLAGCGTGSSNSADQAPVADTSSIEEAAPATEAAEEESDKEEAEAGAPSFAGFDEIQTISLWAMSFYGDAGAKEVEQAINDISVPLINVQIEYHDLDAATYIQQVGLQLAGGEVMDLIAITAIPVVSFSTMSSQGELLDISTYIDEYAAETKEILADYIPAMTVDGKIYGVPAYRMYASGSYIAMRRDILEALDLVEEAEAIDSWDKLEAIMLKVKEAMPTLEEDLQVNALIGNCTNTGDIITSKYFNHAENDWTDNTGYDGLGDSNGMVYLDENEKIQNWFASDDFRTMVERVRRWNEEGLVYKDAATTQETSATLFGTGVTFAQLINAEYGAEEAKVAEMVLPYVMLKITDLPVQASNVNRGWGVASTSENPEAAVAFLNLMVTNADIQNAFTYGIEGRDYEVVDGEAVILDSQVYMASDFNFGNQYNAYPLQGTGADFREKAFEYEKTAEISPYIGFIVSTEPIANELTAVANVISQYKASIVCGDADPSMIDTMVNAMNEAGMETILNYYQEQFDAWKAAQ